MIVSTPQRNVTRKRRAIGIYLFHIRLLNFGTRIFPRKEILLLMLPRLTHKFQISEIVLLLSLRQTSLPL